MAKWKETKKWKKKRKKKKVKITKEQKAFIDKTIEACEKAQGIKDKTIKIKGQKVPIYILVKSGCPLCDEYKTRDKNNMRTCEGCPFTRFEKHPAPGCQVVFNHRHRNSYMFENVIGEYHTKWGPIHMRMWLVSVLNAMKIGDIEELEDVPF